MSHKIHVLSPLLANQIAAGEVVERPASVVKELVENSLDAGAGRIQVDIEGGGIKLIQVRDDGIGISKYDLELAVSRHATSKISDVSDLHGISSLGFRGEALASICSVSRFSITSCPEGSSQASKASVEGRELQLILSPASHPVGTTVTVRDLFFNTPARRKFLRADRTEYQHIEDLVRRFALSRFDVGFVLRNQQRLVFNLRPANNDAERQQRIASVMGSSFIKQSVLIDKDSTEMKIFGWASLPEHARSSIDRQFFYINGRMVRDKLIQHALRQAYEQALPEGRHASYVLFFELPFDKVDVNVHPTKHEVRFHEPRQVHDFIFSALSEVVRQQEQVQVSEEVVYQHQLKSTLHEVREPIATMSYKASPQPKLLAVKTSKYGEPLSMLGPNLILAKTDNQLVLIHVTSTKQHIAYQKLSAVLDGAMLKAQPLLIPQTIDVQPIDYQEILAASKRLKKLAVELDTLGPNTIVIRKLPAILKECRFRDIIQQLISENDITKIIEILCQNIYHSGGQMSKDEMVQLLHDLSNVAWDVNDKILSNPIKVYGTQELEKAVLS